MEPMLQFKRCSPAKTFVSHRQDSYDAFLMISPAGELRTAIIPIELNMRFLAVLLRSINSGMAPAGPKNLSMRICFVGVGLRRAYWVAQVCNADARDHGRVAERVSISREESPKRATMSECTAFSAIS